MGFDNLALDTVPDMMDDKNLKQHPNTYVFTFETLLGIHNLANVIVTKMNVKYFFLIRRDKG